MNRLSVRIALAAIVAILMALASSLSDAHHGWGDYDDSKPLTLKGRVVELHYGNPHATVHVEANGKRWMAILAPVSRMESRGATRELLAVNQEVTVIGFPSRTTADEMRAERVILGGKTVELR